MKKTNFELSSILNTATYSQYLNRLTELSLSMFEWVNLPDSVDARFLELSLFNSGMCVFFLDDVLGYLSLNCSINGKLNVYNVPINRVAYASNGYRKILNEENSVIIYNNYLRTNSVTDVKLFAERLYNLDRIIDVNANAQKTPILIQCDEQQRLSMLNAYKQFDGNSPVIFAGKNLDINSVKVLTTGAPYIADKIYHLKSQIWNEALTYLGISNLSMNKKERLITDEVQRSQGGTIASRESRLEARRQACSQINEMFGLDVWVNFRDGDEVDNE